MIKFIEATGEARELNKLIHRQLLFAAENYLSPKLLILGKQTALRSYGSDKIEVFRIAGFEIPVQIVVGEIVYLVGERA
jgi:hypothetical protein